MIKYVDFPAEQHEELISALVSYRMRLQVIKEEYEQQQRETEQRFQEGLSRWLLRHGYDPDAGPQIVAEMDELNRLGYEYQQQNRTGGA